MNLKRSIRRLKWRLERFERFAIDVVYDRRAGRGARVFGGFLRVLSVLFSGIAQLRCFLYRKRILRDQPLGCLVVVVGNLTVGGTGKTPVVEKFARSLAERGRKVAILSRGYKSRPEPLLRRLRRKLLAQAAPAPKIVSDGHHILLDSENAGDEPYMLARNLPGVIVLVDKNRVKAGQYAIKHFGVDTLLLDDGFQYLPLRGQLNLLLIDKSNPFGNRCTLPRGILREPVKHLRRASYVFLTKSNGQPDLELEALIRRHKPDAEIIECAHRPQFLRAVNGRETRPLETLRDARIAAFSGIAMPESFEEFLRRFGARLVYNRRFIDHHRFSDYELDAFFTRAAEAAVDFAITTEKDAVRIRPDYQAPIPCFFLRLEVDILSGVQDFEDAVSRICFPKSEMRATRTPFPRRGSIRRFAEDEEGLK